MFIIYTTFVVFLGGIHTIKLKVSQPGHLKSLVSVLDTNIIHSHQISIKLYRLRKYRDLHHGRAAENTGAKSQRISFNLPVNLESKISQKPVRYQEGVPNKMVGSCIAGLAVYTAQPTKHRLVMPTIQAVYKPIMKVLSPRLTEFSP